MPNAIIRLNPGTGGSGIDAEELTVDGETVRRSRIQIAGSNASDILKVPDGIVYTSRGKAILEGHLTGTAGQFVGRIFTSTTARQAIQRNAYTDQASGAQRSVASGSASDSAAGIGAHTVKICYYKELIPGSVTGPFFETVTLNGGTAVPTVATDIKYIEYADVETAGSNNASVGTITVYVNAAGGGGTICSIQAGERSTNLCHHFVPTGKACLIQGITAGATVSGNSIFELSSLDLSVTDAAEKWIKGLERIWPHGAARATQEMYQEVPIKVQGPARIRGYVTPGAANSTNHLTVSYYEV